MLLAGVGMLSFAIIQYAEHQAGLKKALTEANALVQQPVTENTVETISLTDTAHSDPFTDRNEFNPNPNDVIGMLQIPELDAELPIIEGTDEEMLKRGVGHYTDTVFPSDGEQILLSGHRDTVFRDFGKLSIGDRFVVNMPYGSFEYEIRSTDIVDKDDTTVIRSMGTEVLVVSTCYPFRYVGDAPDRYVVYAYPIEDPALPDMQ